MAKQLLQNLAFGTLPFGADSIAFDGKFIIYDNLDKPMAEAFTDSVRAFFSDGPRKIDFPLSIICTRGGVDLRCNLHPYSLREGSVMSLFPGAILESFQVWGGSSLIVMAFADDTLAGAMLGYGYASPATLLVQPVTVNLSEGILDEVVQTYRQLRRVLEAYGSEAGGVLLRSYLQVLSGLVDLSRKQGGQHPSLQPLGVKDKVLRDFLVNVEKDFMKYRDVAHYAGMASLEGRHFGKTILLASGRHPAEWIRDRVILEAKALLRSGCSIQEVCDALSFQSQSHFGRYFKSATGLTPKAYRDREA